MKQTILLLLSLIITMSACAKSPFVAQSLQRGISASDVQKMSWRKVSRFMPDDFYSTREAQEIADRVIYYQQASGGWAKYFNYLICASCLVKVMSCGPAFTILTLKSLSSAVEMA